MEVESPGATPSIKLVYQSKKMTHDLPVKNEQQGEKNQSTEAAYAKVA